jgi:hypothetical protein
MIRICKVRSSKSGWLFFKSLGQYHRPSIKFKDFLNHFITNSVAPIKIGTM